MNSWKAILMVWRRYAAVFRKNFVYGMLTTFTEPLLYLLSFGFGLGSMIGGIQAGERTVSYRAFVLAGILGQTLLFQGFFEAAYGGFIRMYYQKIFQAIAVTPVTLSEVLWGELIWDASRAMLAGAGVLLVGVSIGDFRPMGALLLLPICFLFGMIFSALGLWVAGRSRTIESISYPQYLLVFPMFLFCGVFFPLNNLPVALRWIAELFPLTAVLAVIRSLVLGAPYDPRGLLVLAAWTLLLVPMARRTMTNRLVS